MKQILSILAMMTSICAQEVCIDDSYAPFWQQLLTVDKVLFEGKSEHQHIKVFENGALGRVLLLNGAIQLTESDEAEYHEMLVHVPMLAHANPRRILIIGGGDGGTLREVLRHSTVDKVTLVDIDKQVIEQSKKFLPSLSKGAFDDARVELIIQDGMDYIVKTDQKFDVIICDSTEPVGPGKSLFTTQFYGHCKGALNDKGIFVSTHGAVGLNETKYFKDIAARKGAHFKDASYYLTVVPVAVGGFVALGWATNCENYRNISEKVLNQRLKRVKGEMQYYNPAIHKASFALPQYMSE